MGKLKIVIINGQGGVGKDLFINYCNDYYAFLYSYSTVDFIKSIANTCGWKGTKTPADRKMLSELKRVLKEWDDIPYKKTQEFIEIAQNHAKFSEKDEILFIHCREPEEIQRLKDEFNAITVLIRRPEVEKEWGNLSDDEVFDFFYDYIIINRTIEELKQSAQTFIETINSEEVN